MDVNIEHESSGSAAAEVKRCRYITFDYASCIIDGKRAKIKVTIIILIKSCTGRPDARRNIYKKRGNTKAW